MTIDATTGDFQAKVIERSRQVPVVVDFWAEWCGPCRALGPVLEKEVGALGGRVDLVKVDTDANQALAQEYGISSIPAVKAFRDGKIVAEFVGAQPAHAVRTFLKSLAPSPFAELVRKGDVAAIEGLLASVDEEEAAPLQRYVAFTRDTRWPDASALAARGDVLGAIGKMIDLLTERKAKGDEPKQAIVELMKLPGLDPDAVRDLRRRLQIVT